MSGRSTEAAEAARHASASKKRALAAAAAIGATHRGSGCALGDLVAEWLVVVFPIALFGSRILGTWAIDYVIAFLFGVGFQYFTIKPMRDLSVIDGIKAAVKADTAMRATTRGYVATWIALLVLLAITCGTSFLPLGRFNLMINVGVAIIKALLVLVVFMRLFRSARMVLVVALIAAFDLAMLVCLSLPDFLARGF